MISVVIPTIGSHTLEQFEEAISSALAVSPELISQVCIMDNSKNEEFQNKMKSYLERDKRVEYQHKKEQLNLAQNLNRGFEVADLLTLPDFWRQQYNQKYPYLICEQNKVSHL